MGDQRPPRSMSRLWMSVALQYSGLALTALAGLTSVGSHESIIELAEDQDQILDLSSLPPQPDKDIADPNKCGNCHWAPAGLAGQRPIVNPVFRGLCRLRTDTSNASLPFLSVGRNPCLPQNKAKTAAECFARCKSVGATKASAVKTMTGSWNFGGDACVMTAPVGCTPPPPTPAPTTSAPTTPAPTTPAPTPAPTTPAPTTPAPTTPAPTPPTSTPTLYPTGSPTFSPILAPSFSPTYFYDLDAAVKALPAYQPRP